MRKSNKIAVLGGGLWGTVLAQHLRHAGADRVWLWEFFADAAAKLGKTRRHPHIPGFRLDDEVRVTSDLGAAVAASDVLVVVLPSHFVRRTAREAAKSLGRKPFVVVNASKGVEPGTLRTMGEALEEELPSARAVYTLSGPSFAREVAKGVPTRMLLAGPRGRDAAALEKLFDGGPLRVSWTEDRKGVELGGSLKNVLAIGCGILDGLEAGANTKAAAIIQGMDEMGRLIKACGGRSETVFGLAGLGDLIATGTSPESRNRGFGEKLGRGMSPARAQKAIPTVVEGIEASGSAHALAKLERVKLPLIEAIWAAVHESRPPRGVLRALGF